MRNRPRYVVLLAFAPVLVDAAVYRCEQADGSVLFTDLACPNATPADPSVDRISRADGLGDAERTMLAEVDAAARRRAEGNHARTERVVAKRAERDAARAERRAEACAKARRELAQLRQVRRKGYRAEQAAALDLRESRQRALAREHCDAQL